MFWSPKKGAFAGGRCKSHAQHVNGLSTRRASLGSVYRTTRHSLRQSRRSQSPCSRTQGCGRAGRIERRAVFSSKPKMARNRRGREPLARLQTERRSVQPLGNQLMACSFEADQLIASSAAVGVLNVPPQSSWALRWQWSAVYKPRLALFPFGSICQVATSDVAMSPYCQLATSQSVKADIHRQTHCGFVHRPGAHPRGHTRMQAMRGGFSGQPQTFKPVVWRMTSNVQTRCLEDNLKQSNELSG